MEKNKLIIPSPEVYTQHLKLVFGNLPLPRLSDAVPMTPDDHAIFYRARAMFLGTHNTERYCVMTHCLFALVLGGDIVLIPMDSNFMTINQVAEKYGVTRLTVVRLMEANKFKANRFGHGWRIDRQSLEDYFNSNTVSVQSAEKEIA